MKARFLSISFFSLLLSMLCLAESSELNKESIGANYEKKANSQVHIADEIEDPINDELIREAFRSQEFVNLVLHYRLNDTRFRVRLLYNPERRFFSATRKFNFFLWGISLVEKDFPITITWDHIFGIYTDRKVDSELINHIYDLSNTSLLEWYVNFDVQNGTSVEYREGNRRYETGCSWFDYTEEFH